MLSTYTFAMQKRIQTYNTHKHTSMGQGRHCSVINGSDQNCMKKVRAN